MIQQNELVTFLVGFGVALYVLANSRRFRSIPNFRLLLAAYMGLFSGWALTILEGFAFPSLFNILEHLSYALCSIMIAAWCRVTFQRGGKQG
ncbi:MAG: hypothetical protein P1S46_09985 [bacterium]|nr:hypothetical protein [bacterium]MDT8396387.1 hypothetical protein [bacterium]